MSTFCDRLKTAMSLRNMKAADLATATGLSKPRISQYVNGIYEAKQTALYLLAQALNVSEAWLMGYDVPMDRNAHIKETATPSISKEAAALIETLSNLPSEKEDFANRVLELVNLILQVSADKYPLLEDLLRVYLKNL